MTDMIERVARAICQSLEADDFDALSENGVIKAAYRQQARAAIEAMREPINPMLHAASRAMCPDCRPTPEYVSVKQKHRIRYRAMIDAALGKEPDEALSRATNHTERA